MSNKSIAIKAVAGIAVIALLAALIYFLSLPDKTAEVKELSILELDEKKVQEIKVDGAESFVLKKGESGWSINGMEGVKVNQAYASSLVKSLSGIKSPMLAGENVSQLHMYGLEDGAIVIEIKGDGIDETLKIGNKTGEFYYVCREGFNDVYVVKEKDLYMVFMKKMQYLDNKAFTVNTEEVDYIAYNDVVLEKVNDEWQQIQPYNYITATNVVKEQVVLPLGEIEALEILPEKEIQLQLITKVVVGAGENEYTFDISADEDNYYIVKEDSDYIYRVDEGEVAFLSLTGFDLLEKYITPVSITEISKIELISPYKTTVLSIDAPSSQAPVFYKNGDEVTEESFRDFYRILMGLTFKDEGYAESLAEYAIIFTKENSQVVDVRFLPYNDSEYAISINGKTEFLILKKSVTDVFDYLTLIEYVK